MYLNMALFAVSTAVPRLVVSPSFHHDGEERQLTKEVMVGLKTNGNE